MYLVKGVAECVGLGAGHRVFKVPRQYLTSTWKGLALQRRLIAQCDDVFETLAGKLIDGLAAQSLGVYAKVLKRIQGAWINLTRLSACAECLEAFGISVS